MSIKTDFEVLHFITEDNLKLSVFKSTTFYGDKNVWEPSVVLEIGIGFESDRYGCGCNLILGSVGHVDIIVERDLIESLPSLMLSLKLFLAVAFP